MEGVPVVGAHCSLNTCFGGGGGDAVGLFTPAPRGEGGRVCRGAVRYTRVYKDGSRLQELIRQKLIERIEHV